MSKLLIRSHPLPGGGPRLTGRSRAGFPFHSHPLAEASLTVGSAGPPTLDGTHPAGSGMI